MIQNNDGNFSLSQNGLLLLISEVDELFTKQYREVTGTDFDKRLLNIYNEIVNNFMSKVEDDNLWADMPIYLSSYKFKDKSPFGEVVLRLTQYLGFYKKILTDKGLIRKVITHRDFQNFGHSEGESKGYNSDTPQTTLDNFEDSIKFASALNKNEDETDTNSHGLSNLTVDSNSWEEAEKNLKLIFYNDLVTYVRSIPRLIYREYSLDTMPADAIVEETFKYFRDMYERR